MTPFNLRSLLLAAIFLSNCISWTASRHHYTHNVNGHRSRHRRQGAGLFLSASYVLPGGEGSGWGEWGEVSPCSRTCGGGVASQKRICLQIGPDGQPQCTGGDTKYFSCQTQDCPAGSKDFRAEQCSEYDDQLFRDIKYTWVPYMKAPKSCELNCMPHAERFYYRHKAKVVDGTRCSDESFDVCVNGTCQPVGCDMMLGSSAKEDKCRECRGNNANCHTTSGLLDTVDLRKGYNDMLLIPEGATTIVIAEVRPSNNYLALRAKNGTFYLNGDYHIDFPRNLHIAGVMWTYERSQQGFAAPDKLRCLGPTNEPVYLSLLLQDENVGIDYEYSLPTNMAPPQNKRYNWVHEEFTPCSDSCGGGFQTRTVSCRSREELEVVDEGLCDEGMRPPTNQSCNTQACDPQWVPTAWGECSKRCGSGGSRSREVICQKIITNGNPSIVADKECFDLRGPKPELFQKCNENATCPTWFTGPWKPCDKLCDEGKQTRQVVCYQKNGRKIEVLGDEHCEDERPADKQSCMLQPCDGVDWVVSPWNGCDSCLSTIRTRTAICATKQHVVVNDSFCAYHTTPSIQELCDRKKLPACQVQWYATQWSNCSVKCGEGLQTRKVFCGLFDGTSVQTVNDSACADQPKYNSTKPCEIPKELCPSQWFSGPWSACDKKCGGGEQLRRVMCLRNEERATDCVPDPVPVSVQSCNTGPCTSDEFLPANSSDSPIDEAYDDCVEEDPYPEVGLDDTDTDTTVRDLMYSDSVSEEGSGMLTTAFAELESKFTDTDSIEFITVDGSGTSSSETLYTDDLTDETGSGGSTVSLTDDTESTVSGASTATSADSGSTSVSSPGSTKISTTKSTTKEDGSSEIKSTVSGASTATSADSGSTSVSSPGSTKISTTKSTTKEDGSSEIKSTVSGASTATSADSGSTSVSSPGSTKISTTKSTTKEDGSSEIKSTVSGASTATSADSGSTSVSLPGSTKISTTKSTTKEDGSSEIKSTVSGASTATSADSGSTSVSSPGSTKISTTKSTTKEDGSSEIKSTVSGASTATSADSGSTSVSSPGSTKISTTKSTTKEDGSSEIKSTVSGASTATSADSGSTSVSSPGSTKISTTKSTTKEDGSSEIKSTVSGASTATSADSGSTSVSLPGSTKISTTKSTTKEDGSSEIKSTVSGASTATSADSGSTSVSSPGSTKISTTKSTTKEDGSSETKSTVSGASTATSADSGSTSVSSPGSTKISTTKSTTKEDGSSEIKSTVSGASTATSADSGSTSVSSPGSTEISTTKSTTKEDGSSEIKSTVSGASTATSADSGSTSVSSPGSTKISTTKSTTKEDGSSEIKSTVSGASTATSADSGSTSVSSPGSTKISTTKSTTKEDGSSEIKSTVSGASTATSADSGSTSVSSPGSTKISTTKSTTKEDGSSEIKSTVSGASTATSADSGSTSVSSPGSTKISTTKSTTKEDGSSEIKSTVSGASTATSADSGSTSVSSPGSTKISTTKSTTKEDGSSEIKSTVSGASTATSADSGSTSVSSPGSTKISTTKSTTKEDGSSEIKSTVSGASTATSADSGSTSVSSPGSTKISTTKSTTKEDGKPSAADTNTTTVKKHIDSTTSKTTYPPEAEESSINTTESRPTDETSDTDSTTDTNKDDAITTETATSDTAETVSTETSETADIETPESTETTESDSTETTESGPTDTSETTEASETTETGSTETSEVTVASTDVTETTESGASTEITSTDFTETSETTEAGSSETTESTDSSQTTESGPTDTTETTESGPTDTTETTESGPTDTTETTESGSTDTTETTESGPTETTESGSTDTTETTESGATETTETTESGSTEITETGSTETSEMSTTEAEGLTSSSVEWFTPKKPRMCRPSIVCADTDFGCCPDRKTIAGGPFDEGCPKPETCLQTKFGCCPDGVSPAPSPNKKDCPLPACADTLFGCCASDNKTAAGGNDQEDCPLPPPACESSTYGCCKDGETEATGPAKEGCPETTVSETEPPTSTTPVYEGCESSEFGCCFDNTTDAAGPDGQGCPCNISEFGCCYDGVSPAQGPAYEGCSKTCQQSAYGCCPDGNTPAHGPNKEGCCIRSSFGCCPDNQNYARGPHLEGCGCQYSPYGCCPDNATSASGHDNKGCGCSYSPHGCCPDGHTESSGPEFEGCACHTYQFGCCPDGVTIARGPDGQGCHCLQSKYKCCEDGETHATGPDHEGCDCSSSKYGCCPDGQTKATGSKFQGCTDAPENKQAACGLKFARGPCRNYTVYWYFDTEYGGCSRFWYGGCEGNGNRFTTKEECDDTCVNPQSKEACKLPQSKGACLSYNVRWYYDSERESCNNFAYGGCLGNSNNFATRELCQKQCEPEKSTEQCSLPIERGSCAGNFPRWGFDQESRRCEQFTWGGCEGNPNRFSTEAACNLRCNPPGQPKPECSEPQDVGLCSKTEAVWSFSQSENRCVPFYYTECGGNGNRFASVEACQASCPSAYVPDKCTLPYDTGNCANYREKWYFDTKEQRCRQFYYGGCGGNENNFDSELECQGQCLPILTTTTVQTTIPQLTTPRNQNARSRFIDRQDFCFLEMDVGPCTNYKTSWAYDYKTGRCTTFQYGGCGGNRNNFPDEKYCQYYCKATQDICQLAMLSGPCNDSQMRWFYDASTDSCSQFAYGGCEGNDNRFESRDECENRCKTGPAAEQTTVTTTVVVDPSLPATCTITPTLEACGYEQAGEVWYLNPSTHECISHQNLADGRNCRVTGVFKSQEGCERSCGAFRDIDVCAYPLDAGRCNSFVSKYFYNGTSGRCEEFAYGGCIGGPNRFSTELECFDICKPSVDPCKQQPEPGNCLARYEQWYYDEGIDQCRQFIYSGCRGNENRFESQGACEGRCKKQPDEVVTTTTTQAPVQLLAPECVTPETLQPCGNNETVFYYDAETSTCRVSEFGGCRHPNSYSSDEECERHCGAFRGIDVCRALVDPGPCKAALPKYFYDAADGSCKEFAYGGCQGGPNRFSTIEECEDNCKEVGPAPACLQEVAIGDACGTLPSRRWYYSPARRGCLVFAYQGCGGNENNFLSYQECADHCVPLDLCYKYGEECEALQSTCEYRIKVTVASEGCERCSCEQPSCEQQQQTCDTIQCTYGVERITEDDGCESCVCAEDPCSKANCSANEQCVASAYRDPATKRVQYTANCVPDTDNEVLPECEQNEEHCAQLSCPYGVQKTMTSRGCVRCACVPEEVNCKILREECDNLKCTYGIERIGGEDGCERCKCLQHPCGNKNCSEGERCVPTPYRDAVTQENRYRADCRLVVKSGFCPVDNARSTESSCRAPECNDDADCRGVGKCCSRGCNRLCVAPEEPTTTTPAPVTQHITTYRPDAPQAPLASTDTEPEMAVAEGGKATLRCIFHGNPPPKITWRFGMLTIDGDRDRYRLLTDGALEIVALVRNDSGVYVCVADNHLGTAQQEIQLLVSDPVTGPVYIAGDANAVIVGELGRPLQVRCRAYGYPPPEVYWYRGINGPMVPFSNTLYEARGQILTIHSLTSETLGEYVCYAYNGQGKAATWVVTVQAYQPDDNAIGQFFVPRDRVVPVTPRERTTTTITTTILTPDIEVPQYIVKVTTQLLPASTLVTAGSELSLPCDVNGYPEPRVTWIKNNVTLAPTDTMWITGTRLTIPRATVSDSGVYTCHAANQYSSHSSTVQINVQEKVIPAKCTDSAYFANCALIVQGKFCKHKYYSKFCCKSCVEAGQLDPSEVDMQSDEPYRKK